jgi:hypothetical protein
MDVTYWADDLTTDPRTTGVTVQFDGQEHSVVASNPNLGNGLLMAQFPFTIGPLSGMTTSSKVLKVIVDAEDTILLAEEEVAPPALDVIIGADERVFRVMHSPVYGLLPAV